jgi:5-methylcytosine-specific restriction endonuclease McrA
MYITKKMTTAQMAKTSEMSTATISNWLRRNEIPIRQGRDAQLVTIPDRETLVRLYVEDDLSMEDVGARVELNALTVAKLLKEYGIPIRDKTARFAGWNKGKPLPNWQKKLLSRVAKKRVGPLAPRFGVQLSDETKKKIANSLNGRFRGKLNPQWKPDATHKWRTILHERFEYKEWRKQVFHRDSYTCRACLKPSTGDIQAHHILPVETHPDLILDPNNGITLCIKCHRSAQRISVRRIIPRDHSVSHPVNSTP